MNLLLIQVYVFIYEHYTWQDHPIEHLVVVFYYHQKHRLLINILCNLPDSTFVFLGV